MSSLKVTYSKQRVSDSLYIKVSIEEWDGHTLKNTISATQDIYYGNHNNSGKNFCVTVGIEKSYFINHTSKEKEWYDDIVKLYNMILSLIDSSPCTYLNFENDDASFNPVLAKPLELDNDKKNFIHRILSFANDKRFLSFDRHLTHTAIQNISSISIFSKPIDLNKDIEDKDIEADTYITSQALQKKSGL